MGTHAVTEVSWSTGHRSSADVIVAAYPLDAGLPDRGEAILAEVERLGLDFLLVPAVSLWWLDLYPELARRLDNFVCLADDRRAGRLYDLRP